MITIDTNIVVRYLIKDDEIFVGRVSDSVTRHNISRLSGYGYRLTRPTFSFSTEYESIEKLMLKYCDVPMSFADACLVRMSEQHKNACVFTLDSDFLLYRKNGNEVISLIYPDNK